MPLVGKNGPIDNLLGARSFKILSSVSVTPNRIRQLLEGIEIVLRDTHRLVLPCVVTALVFKGWVRSPHISGSTWGKSCTLPHGIQASGDSALRLKA